VGVFDIGHVTVLVLVVVIDISYAVDNWLLEIDMFLFYFTRYFTKYFYML
jgi:hypothetical protein